MWMKDKKRIRFQKAKFLESSKELGNPGRGWYHIYPFVIQNPPEFSLEETRSCILDISREENLVLVRIDIGAFQSCEIPKEALETVSDIFHLFHSPCQLLQLFFYTFQAFHNIIHFQLHIILLYKLSPIITDFL